MTDQEKEQLRQELINNIEGLANLLMPGGKWRGDKWICDNLYGGEGRSFNMERSGELAGVWNDFATQEAGDIFQLIMANQGLDFPQALEWAKDFTGSNVQVRKSAPKPEPVKHVGYDSPPEIAYVYHDKNMKPVLWVERVEVDGKKRFVQWSESNGKYYKTSVYCPKPHPLWGIYGAELYDVVIIHEGEKCAEFAREEGLKGYHTCTIGGASNARTADYSPLAGRSVVYICPDNDDPGKKYANDVTECLKGVGVREVRVINLEPLPHKGDVVDWFELGKTVEDWSLAVANASTVYTQPVIEPEVKEKSNKDFRYVPEDMLSMPGFVNDVVDYTLSVSPYPNRVHAFGAAVCLQALLASNRIVGDMATRPNIYINSLGSSASGKNKPRVVNRQILNALGAHTHIFDNMASMEGLEDLLEQHSNVLFQPDEFDSFLAASATGDSRFRRISTYLMTLYTSADADITRRPKAYEKSSGSQLGRIIQRPHLSMLATSTPTRYFESLDSQSMSDGFVGRMWTLCSEPKPRELVDSNKDFNRPIPDSVLDVANHWWKLNAPECVPVDDRPKYVFPREQLVPVSPKGLEARMDADKYFTDRYNQNLEDDVRCAVYGRGLEHVNKWSLLMACSEDPYNLVVTEKHIEAALMFVRYQIKTVLEANDSYVYKNEDEKNTKRVRQVLRDNGGQCSRRDLMRKTRFSKKRMNDVLSTMEDSGDIELEVVPTAGRPSTIIRIAV
jgi:hypothetical protein